MGTRRRSGNVAATLPTIGDVARRAGVSKATASRALGGSHVRVSDALTERVRRAAVELNYVANRNARALARATSDTIGLIVHDVSDPYFGEIARGVLAAAGVEDRLVVICNTFRDPASEARYVAELRAQRVAAVILAGSGYVEQAAAALRRELELTTRAGARVVVLSPHGCGRAVLPDNHGGGALVAEHLATLGHQQVAVAAGPAHLIVIHHRLEGFLERWRAAGRPEPRVTYTSFDREGGRAAVADLDLTETTAVFALNDLMAIGALHELSMRGSVPGRDVSVVGFDDIPLAADVSPGLTTIRVPMEELGRRAVAALAEDPDLPPEILGCEMVLRGTTGPAPFR